MRIPLSDSREKSRDIWLFQLYLLSVMRVEATVLKQALQQLDASEEDLEAAKSTLVSLGFEEIGARAELYRGILGFPLRIERPDDNLIPPAFKGSLRLCFKLPLWPDMEFIVYEDPEGPAWDLGFRRAAGADSPPLASIADLKPWKFVKDELTSSFGEPRFGDAWDRWEELYYTIPSPSQGSLTKCYVLFDYSLLQSFDVCA